MDFMSFFERFKIAIAPVIASTCLIIYFLTDNELYLFLTKSLISIFSLAMIIALLLILLKFGSRTSIELEVEAVPWVIFFLVIIILLFI